MSAATDAVALTSSLMKPGTALVICGRQGTGKTVLAMLLANAVSNKVGRCSIQDLQNIFKTPLTYGVEVLVVDGLDSKNQLHTIRSLVANSVVEIERQGIGPETVPVPQIIVTSSLDANCFTSGDQRRFVNITIDGGP